jgi:hypothetical protein
MEPSKSVMRPILHDTAKAHKYVFKNGKFYEDAFFKKISFELLNGLTYANGDTYKGIIKNVEFAGKFKTKTCVYMGSFRSWKADGYGKIIYTAGGIFEGIMKNGSLLSGTFKFGCGNIYEGSFSNQKFEGFGIMLYNNGDRYEGLWKNHKRHSWGQMIYREKSVRTYEGFWEDGNECNSKMKCEKLA